MGGVRVQRARGGVSAWAVITGLLVAVGAFVILSAIVGWILAATGVAKSGIKPDEAATAGIGAGIGLVVSQLLAYVWGGYTAGRMARGSGIANGILVPVVALVLLVILGALVAGIVGTTTNVRPADVQRLPVPLGKLSDIGTGVGIGLLVAMLLGGALGGHLGARWHARLEREHGAI